MDLYRDSSLSPKVRARDLLSKMTLDEKIAQLGSLWSYELLTEDGKLSIDKANSLLKHGIGQNYTPGWSNKLRAVRSGETGQRDSKVLGGKDTPWYPCNNARRMSGGIHGVGSSDLPTANRYGKHLGS